MKRREDGRKLPRDRTPVTPLPVQEIASLLGTVLRSEPFEQIILESEVKQRILEGNFPASSFQRVEGLESLTSPLQRPSV
jgi:hypothetical protein